MTADLIAGYLFAGRLVLLVLLRKRWPAVDTAAIIILCLLAYVGVWAIVRMVMG